MRQPDWSTLESLSRSRPSVAEAVASDEWIAMSEVQLGDLTFNFNHHQINPSIYLKASFFFNFMNVETFTHTFYN